MEISTVNDFGDKKLEFNYPCSWTYKVIGNDEKSVKNAIVEVVLEKSHKIEPSQISQNGKYHSFNLEIIVSSEDERIIIYESLRKHQSVKMVL